MKINERFSGRLFVVINKLIVKDSGQVNFQQHLGRTGLYLLIFIAEIGNIIRSSKFYGIHIRMILHNRKNIFENNKCLTLILQGALCYPYEKVDHIIFRNEKDYMIIIMKIYWHFRCNK